MKTMTTMSGFLKRTVKLGAAALVAVSFASGAYAAGKAIDLVEKDWSFSGVFGKYDKAQLQRGFQVFSENCASCHSADYLRFRNLMEPGGTEFSEAEVRAIATNYVTMDGPDADGEMFEREARLSDTWPNPWANEQQARASNNGAYPPDFSTLAKARAVERGFPTFVFDIFTQYQESGPDYIYNLLTGYEDPPEDVVVQDGLYYNTKFIAGEALAMAQPLYEGSHPYADGSPETVSQYAEDVAAFMMWMAEPKLMERKQMGFVVMVFLGIFAVLLLFTKRKVWANVAH